ncbi:glycosyl hydrolase 108 family protein [Mucilaginibacter sp. X4EP1]|uniref:glycosyl hydrolase 108 family protein n=1 Tax=Mucilaginibacter sp. X4EP1 TaxID=2723092 RepID=UPI0021690C0F|nr:glycosyl hydrolase 108 family protein [Mucilaginibacter sp. X4EP1]MCS3814167.1 lysozyme family protein [Mucilaginibacter sp. X4EP1]
MAAFITAFNITMQTEGGYNPGQGEAETYMGVDRSQNPNWSGWVIITAIKAANPGSSVNTLDSLFEKNADLQTDVQSFYKTNYWDTLQLDTVNDQQVANALFDCSVNPCIISASKAAQIACNTVTPGAVGVDGQVGSLTIAGINKQTPSLFVTAFNGIRVANYYQRVSLTPADKQWLSSWLGRCKPYAQGNA